MLSIWGPRAYQLPIIHGRLYGRHRILVNDPATVRRVMHENAAMLGVFRDAGFGVTRAAEGREVEIRLAITPTSTYREQVAARDHLAVRASLEPFFRPNAVAVIGASRRRGPTAESRNSHDAGGRPAGEVHVRHLRLLAAPGHRDGPDSGPTATVAGSPTPGGRRSVTVRCSEAFRACLRRG